MEALADRYASREVEFVFVYTREVHPGEKLPYHTSFEQKMQHAGRMVSHFGVRRRMLVDDLDGTVHRAYGGGSNVTFIVARGGRLAYRASWTDPGTIEPAVEQLLQEDQTKGRTDAKYLVPFSYFVEWQARKAMNRLETLQYLREVAGERAADEFAQDMDGKGANIMRRILADLRKEE